MLSQSSLEPFGEEKTSPVWEYFCKHPFQQRVVCLPCWPEQVLELQIKDVPIKSARSSTESLARHLRVLHNIHISLGQATPVTQQRTIDSYTCSRDEKESADHSLFLWLSKSHLPYSYVNNHDLKSFCQTLHPGYKLGAVETMKGILDTEVEKVNNYLKVYLKSKLVGGALSADGWTSLTGDSYFGILLHFIDEDAVPRTILLDAMPKSQQTSEKLAERV
jgi:hypothetical protein